MGTLRKYGWSKAEQRMLTAAEEAIEQAEVSRAFELLRIAERDVGQSWMLRLLHAHALSKHAWVNAKDEELMQSLSLPLSRITDLCVECSRASCVQLVLECCRRFFRCACGFCEAQIDGRLAELVDAAESVLLPHGGASKESNKSGASTKASAAGCVHVSELQQLYMPQQGDCYLYAANLRKALAVALLQGKQDKHNASKAAESALQRLEKASTSVSNTTLEPLEQCKADVQALQRVASRTESASSANAGASSTRGKKSKNKPAGGASFATGSRGTPDEIAETTIANAQSLISGTGASSADVSASLQQAEQNKHPAAAVEAALALALRVDVQSADWAGLEWTASVQRAGLVSGHLHALIRLTEGVIGAREAYNDANGAAKQSAQTKASTAAAKLQQAAATLARAEISAVYRVYCAGALWTACTVLAQRPERSKQKFERSFKACVPALTKALETIPDSNCTSWLWPIKARITCELAEMLACKGERIRASSLSEQAQRMRMPIASIEGQAAIQLAAAYATTTEEEDAEEGIESTHVDETGASMKTNVLAHLQTPLGRLESAGDILAFVRSACAAGTQRSAERSLDAAENMISASTSASTEWSTAQCNAALRLGLALEQLRHTDRARRLFRQVSESVGSTFAMQSEALRALGRVGKKLRCFVDAAATAASVRTGEQKGSHSKLGCALQRAAVGAAWQEVVCDAVDRKATERLAGMLNTCVTLAQYLKDSEQLECDEMAVIALAAALGAEAAAGNDESSEECNHALDVAEAATNARGCPSKELQSACARLAVRLGRHSSSLSTAAEKASAAGISDQERKRLVRQAAEMPAFETAESAYKTAQAALAVSEFGVAVEIGMKRPNNDAVGQLIQAEGLLGFAQCDSTDAHAKAAALHRSIVLATSAAKAMSIAKGKARAAAIAVNAASKLPHFDEAAAEQLAALATHEHGRSEGNANAAYAAALYFRGRRGLELLDAAARSISNPGSLLRLRYARLLLLLENDASSDACDAELQRMISASAYADSDTFARKCTSLQQKASALGMHQLVYRIMQTLRQWQHQQQQQQQQHELSA